MLLHEQLQATQRVGVVAQVAAQADAVQPFLRWQPRIRVDRHLQVGAARNALRRTELQVPVDEDARLMPAEWLDRIRLRRDLGDSANALRSLQLFVQEHPFQRVPDDLRPLLGTP